MPGNALSIPMLYLPHHLEIKTLMSYSGPHSLSLIFQAILFLLTNGLSHQYSQTFRALGVFFVCFWGFFACCLFSPQNPSLTSISYVEIILFSISSNRITLHF